MRQMISGLVAAIAVMAASAVPAMACGGLFDGGCSPCGYVSPCAQTYVPTYSGCNTGCGGWGYRERLPDPVQQYGAVAAGSPQYYYVDQGPTYTGPGNFAPYPTYQEGAVSDWGTYRHHPYRYGYDGAPNVEGPAIYRYRAHPRFHRWHEHMGYRYSMRPSIRYGYAPHRYGYASQHVYVPHHYGYREHGLRRYN
jgi:hypothetical protein